MASSAPPAFPPPGSLKARLMNRVVGLAAVAYKVSGGRIGGKMEDLPVLLLEHVGRKTGQTRTSPLLYIEDGQDLAIVASRGGSDAPPAWSLNIQANPRVTVQIGRERRAVLARQATPEERERLWPRLVAGYPHYDEYQKRTSRQIPVFILSPAT
jgi:F420H(2)-dependent quinone reductase